MRFRGDEAQAGAEWDAHAHAHARAGSDDGMVCVYEHRAGVGSTLLGGDGPSLENWRTSRVLPPAAAWPHRAPGFGDVL